MDTQTMLVYVAKASYFLAAVLFILGIKRMSSPVTAKKGIVQAGIGMVIATLATFAITGGHNLPLIVIGIAIGVIPTWRWGRKVAMTDMPQMVALFNGMGGGSAAAIGAGELLKFTSGAETPPLATLALAVVGFPCIALWAGSGSMLRNWLARADVLRVFNWGMAALLVASILPGLWHEAVRLFPAN